jgi:D-arabinose 1-dehydrogenase-like Zn-dependent alcohol dehydrogenase
VSAEVTYTQSPADGVLCLVSMSFASMHLISDQKTCFQKAEHVVPGHEIVGKVVHVGEDASDEFKEGQRVGVGAQVFSCLDCDR